MHETYQARAAIVSTALLLAAAAYPAAANDELSRVSVATASAGAAELADVIGKSVYSRSGETEYADAFRAIGEEIDSLLLEIEGRSLRGASLSETRDDFARAAGLVELARQLINAGDLEVSEADISAFIQLFESIGAKYHPSPDESISARP